MRLRTFRISKAILEGGIAQPGSMPPPLLRETHAVGNRRGHYAAFISLLRNAASWEAATAAYAGITVPVRLVWGDEDWSRPSEREHDGNLLPGAQVITVAHYGDFLPLDRSDAFISQLGSSAAA